MPAVTPYLAGPVASERIYLPSGSSVASLATAQAPAFLTGDQVPDYLRGVEIVTAGMNWPASTGDVTITMEHIADAVQAANQDPHIQVPRLKLGHTSSLNGDHPNHDPFAALGDAAPSFGRFVNLRTTNDGAVLVGDVEDIPAWLAEAAPSMFPNRSMENAWDVQTEGGKRYSMVITAVSFLGAYLPACKDLEDLVRLATQGPADLTATSKEATVPDLSVSTDAVRQRFNFTWTVDEDNGVDMDTYWWWARDVRLDPNEVIADDDEGNLWSVPFTTDGEDTVTFGQPARVRQTYVPAAAAAAFTRPAKTPRTHPVAPGRLNTERNTPMDDNVRFFLLGRGIDPEAATEEQITEATDAVTAPISEAPAEETPEVEEQPAEEEAPATDPIAVAATAALAETNARLAAAEQRLAARDAADTAARRDGIVASAVQSGRIAPAQRDHYRSLLDIDEDRTSGLLTALAPSVPLAALSDPVGDLAGDDDNAGFSLLTAGQRARKEA